MRYGDDINYILDNYEAEYREASAHSWARLCECLNSKLESNEVTMSEIETMVAEHEKHSYISDRTLDRKFDSIVYRVTDFSSDFNDDDESGPLGSAYEWIPKAMRTFLNEYQRASEIVSKTLYETLERGKQNGRITVSGLKQFVAAVRRAQRNHYVLDSFNRDEEARYLKSALWNKYGSYFDQGKYENKKSGILGQFFYWLSNAIENYLRDKNTR